MAKLKDITGQRFGRLTVVERAENDKRGEARWDCRCDCGSLTTVLSSHLRQGRSLSCGCYRRDIHTTHGKHRTPEYVAWSHMMQRTSNPDDAEFYRYGGRGITVCDRWRVFENFYADMGPRPSPKHSIDRLDNSLGYHPENCAWRTQREQMRNTRFNRLITIDGQTRCTAEWAEIYGISAATVGNRLCSGWPEHLAVTLPKGSKLSDFT